MAFLQRQASAKGEYFKGTVIGRPVAEPEVAKPQVTERPAIDPARLQSQPKAASQGSKGTGRPIPGNPTSKSPITRPATQSPSTRPATVSPATERPGVGVAPGAAAVRLTPQVKSVTSLMQHEPVRLALKQMTGRDFDFDQAAWQQWWDVEGRDLLNVREDFSVPRKRAINDGGPMPATDRGSEPVAKEP